MPGRTGENNTRGKKKKLTQIYKNMPLDSYQQLRTMGALFTEKRQYINIYNNKDFFHIQAGGAYLHLLRVKVMIGCCDSEN